MMPTHEHGRELDGVRRRESDHAGAMGLGRLARVLDEGSDDARHTAGRERLLLAMARRGRRSIARRLVPLAATLALAAAVALVLARKPPRLEYDVAGPVVTDGRWLSVPPSGGALSVHFSDGTELDLGPGSKGRVAEVTGDGALVVLGTGMLQARVVHRPHTHWSVTAGPYTIEVTGTAFDVGWVAASEELDLRLHDGSVVVRGPSLPDGLKVSAGQRLSAHAATGEAELSSLLAPQPTPDAPAAGPSPPATEAPKAEAPVEARSTPRPMPTWSEMLADGNFRGVVDAAGARGIDATLGRAPLADVVALADAARYLQERALARRGLLAERSRFAGSAEARGAAFVLGRMADDGGARDDAIRWYDVYLGESPRGPFAAEALGRKLVALVESGDTVGAQVVAKEYLARFPHGAHAAYAHDHVQEP
jgi:ferric-dicitrate binding protein FerR (iron transport regulator)